MRSKRIFVVEDEPGAGRGKLFEPVFTTKAPGRGTSLGLGVVRRIVVVHDGPIPIHDSVGEVTHRTSKPKLRRKLNDANQGGAANSSLWAAEGGSQASGMPC